VGAPYLPFIFEKFSAVKVDVADGLEAALASHRENS
jgi:hypothetical protein